MKQIITTCIILSFLSCQNNHQQIEKVESENMTQEQIDSVLQAFEFEYAEPIIIDSTDQVLLPISTSLLQSRSPSYNKDDYYSTDYWNILFYNRKTGETNLLTKEKLRISKIDAQYNEYEELPNKRLEEKILYTVKDKDYNEDGYLDYADPKFLFVSEIDGSGFRRISPLNEDLQYHEVVPNAQQIIFKTLRDINQDAIFNSVDEFIWYKAESSNNGEWKIEEIIDSNKRKTIENLYFEQWLKKQ